MGKRSFFIFFQDLTGTGWQTDSYVPYSGQKGFSKQTEKSEYIICSLLVTFCNSAKLKIYHFVRCINSPGVEDHFGSVHVSPLNVP